MSKSTTVNKVHPALVKAWPALVDGLNFSISKEGKIESNVPLDVLHKFLDKHCPDTKFIRTGKFKNNLAKIIEDQTDEVEVDDYAHYCEIMGIKGSEEDQAKLKKTKRVVVIPMVDVPVAQDTPDEKVFPDVSKAVLIYVYMNGALHSISISMFAFAQKDHKMLSMANPIKHYPTCVFMTPDGPKSSEERRPIFHLVDKQLILQAVDTPMNKIRKSDSGVAIRVGHVNDETTASTVYVFHEGTLYSMKPAQFETLRKDISTLSNNKTLKHNPTCVYETGGILYSNDIKRPIYTIVEGKFVQTHQLQTA